MAEKRKVDRAKSLAEQRKAERSKRDGGGSGSKKDAKGAGGKDGGAGSGKKGRTKDAASAAGLTADTDRMLKEAKALMAAAFDLEAVEHSSQ